mmetsp:Transcript_118476/g.335058  ORF Transcript_118476/g.335058 Transcript_118476/m.335058 type:complete len:545 (+) Transcript_118476:103-1737(+)
MALLMAPECTVHAHVTANALHSLPHWTSPQSRDSAPPRPALAPLSRDQLIDFVRDGFTVLYPTVPGGVSFHERVWESAAKLHQAGEIGNNILSDCPELDAVLDAPEVVGALTGLLGEDYVLQAHRHCHAAYERAGNQCWHQDGFEQFRHATFTDIMVMYYPQAVTPSMGPTAVRVGSQYCRQESAANEHAELKLPFPHPGACVVMHFHLWHRATARIEGTQERARFMFKFQFRRSRPFLPAPAALSQAMSEGNPFVCRNVQGSAGLHGVGHRLACAAVWASLSGEKLPQEDANLLSNVRSPYYSAELCVATGINQVFEAFDTLTGKAAGHGAKDGASLLFDVAGALQVCPALSGRLMFDGVDHALLTLLGQPGSHLHVHPKNDEWRLEVLAALPALLSVELALARLVAWITPTQCVRTQTRALMGIYESAVRCGAPNSDVWCAAVGAVPLEDTLLQCIARWEGWLTYAKTTTQPHELLYGRYTLAEALRCVGRFATPSAAQAAVQLIGVPERTELYCGPQWRTNFTSYVERRRRCPITSVRSPF